MTSIPSSPGWTLNIRTADGYLVQRDSQPHSPRYTYTPADADGIRTYLGCASTAEHAHQLITRHRAAHPTPVPATRSPSTSPTRTR